MSVQIGYAASRTYARALAKLGWDTTRLEDWLDYRTEGLGEEMPPDVQGFQHLIDAMRATDVAPFISRDSQGIEAPFNRRAETYIRRVEGWEDWESYPHWVQKGMVVYALSRSMVPQRTVHSLWIDPDVQVLLAYTRLLSPHIRQLHSIYEWRKHKRMTGKVPPAPAGLTGARRTAMAWAAAEDGEPLYDGLLWDAWYIDQAEAFLNWVRTAAQGRELHTIASKWEEWVEANPDPQYMLGMHSEEVEHARGERTGAVTAAPSSGYGLSWGSVKTVVTSGVAMMSMLNPIAGANAASVPSEPATTTNEIAIVNAGQMLAHAKHCGMDALAVNHQAIGKFASTTSGLKLKGEQIQVQTGQRLGFMYRKWWSDAQCATIHSQVTERLVALNNAFMPWQPNFKPPRPADPRPDIAFSTYSSALLLRNYHFSTLVQFGEVGYYSGTGTQWTVTQDQKAMSPFLQEDFVAPLLQAAAGHVLKESPEWYAVVKEVVRSTTPSPDSTAYAALQTALRIATNNIVPATEAAGFADYLTVELRYALQYMQKTGLYTQEAEDYILSLIPGTSAADLRESLDLPTLRTDDPGTEAFYPLSIQAPNLGELWNLKEPTSSHGAGRRLADNLILSIKHGVKGTLEPSTWLLNGHTADMLNSVVNGESRFMHSTMHAINYAMAEDGEAYLNSAPASLRNWLRNVPSTIAASTLVKSEMELCPHLNVPGDRTAEDVIAQTQAFPNPESTGSTTVVPTSVSVIEDAIKQDALAKVEKEVEKETPFNLFLHKNEYLDALTDVEELLNREIKQNHPETHAALQKNIAELYLQHTERKNEFTDLSLWREAMFHFRAAAEMHLKEKPVNVPMHELVDMKLPERTATGEPMHMRHILEAYRAVKERMEEGEKTLADVQLLEQRVDSAPLIPLAVSGQPMALGAPAAMPAITSGVEAAQDVAQVAAAYTAEVFAPHPDAEAQEFLEKVPDTVLTTSISTLGVALAQSLHTISAAGGFAQGQNPVQSALAIEASRTTHHLQQAAQKVQPLIAESGTDVKFAGETWRAHASLQLTEAMGTASLALQEQEWYSVAQTQLSEMPEAEMNTAQLTVRWLADAGDQIDGLAALVYSQRPDGFTAQDIVDPESAMERTVTVAPVDVQRARQVIDGVQRVLGVLEKLIPAAHHEAHSLLSAVNGGHIPPLAMMLVGQAHATVQKWTGMMDTVHRRWGPALQRQLANTLAHPLSSAARIASAYYTPLGAVPEGDVYRDAAALATINWEEKIVGDENLRVVTATRSDGGGRKQVDHSVVNLRDTLAVPAAAAPLSEVVVVGDPALKPFIQAVVEERNLGSVVWDKGTAEGVFTAMQGRVWQWADSPQVAQRQMQNPMSGGVVMLDLADLVPALSRPALAGQKTILPPPPKWVQRRRVELDYMHKELNLQQREREMRAQTDVMKQFADTAMRMGFAMQQLQATRIPQFPEARETFSALTTTAQAVVEEVQELVEQNPSEFGWMTSAGLMDEEQVQTWFDVQEIEAEAEELKAERKALEEQYVQQWASHAGMDAYALKVWDTEMGEHKDHKGVEAWSHLTWIAHTIGYNLRPVINSPVETLGRAIAGAGKMGAEFLQDMKEQTINAGVVVGAAIQQGTAAIVAQKPKVDAAVAAMASAASAAYHASAPVAAATAEETAEAASSAGKGQLAFAATVGELVSAAVPVVLEHGSLALEAGARAFHSILNSGGSEAEAGAAASEASAVEAEAAGGAKQVMDATVLSPEWWVGVHHAVDVCNASLTETPADVYGRAVTTCLALDSVGEAYNNNRIAISRGEDNSAAALQFANGISMLQQNATHPAVSALAHVLQGKELSSKQDLAPVGKLLRTAQAAWDNSTMCSLVQAAMATPVVARSCPITEAVQELVEDFKAEANVAGPLKDDASIPTPVAVAALQHATCNATTMGGDHITAARDVLEFCLAPDAGLDASTRSATVRAVLTNVLVHYNYPVVHLPPPGVHVPSPLDIDTGAPVTASSYVAPIIHLMGAGDAPPTKLKVTLVNAAQEVGDAYSQVIQGSAQPRDVQEKALVYQRVAQQCARSFPAKGAGAAAAATAVSTSVATDAYVDLVCAAARQYSVVADAYEVDGVGVGAEAEVEAEPWDAEAVLQGAGEGEGAVQFPEPVLPYLEQMSNTLSFLRRFVKSMEEMQGKSHELGVVAWGETPSLQYRAMLQDAHMYRDLDTVRVQIRVMQDVFRDTVAMFTPPRSTDKVQPGVFDTTLTAETRRMIEELKEAKERVSAELEVTRAQAKAKQGKAERKARGELQRKLKSLRDVKENMREAARLREELRVLQENDGGDGGEYESTWLYRDVDWKASKEHLKAVFEVYFRDIEEYLHGVQSGEIDDSVPIPSLTVTSKYIPVEVRDWLWPWFQAKWKDVAAKFGMKKFKRNLAVTPEEIKAQMLHAGVGESAVDTMGPYDIRGEDPDMDRIDLVPGSVSILRKRLLAPHKRQVTYEPLEELFESEELREMHEAFIDKPFAVNWNEDNMRRLEEVQRYLKQEGIEEEWDIGVDFSTQLPYVVMGPAATSVLVRRAYRGEKIAKTEAELQAEREVAEAKGETPPENFGLWSPDTLLMSAEYWDQAVQRVAELRFPAEDIEKVQERLKTKYGPGVITDVQEDETTGQYRLTRDAVESVVDHAASGNPKVAAKPIVDPTMTREKRAKKYLMKLRKMLVHRDDKPDEAKLDLKVVVDTDLLPEIKKQAKELFGIPPELWVPQSSSGSRLQELVSPEKMKEAFTAPVRPVVGMMNGKLNTKYPEFAPPSAKPGSSANAEKIEEINALKAKLQALEDKIGDRSQYSDIERSIRNIEEKLQNTQKEEEEADEDVELYERELEDINMRIQKLQEHIGDKPRSVPSGPSGPSGPAGPQQGPAGRDYQNDTAGGVFENEEPYNTVAGNQTFPDWEYERGAQVSVSNSTQKPKPREKASRSRFETLTDFIFSRAGAWVMAGGALLGAGLYAYSKFWVNSVQSRHGTENVPGAIPEYLQQMHSVLRLRGGGASANPNAFGGLPIRAHAQRPGQCRILAEVKGTTDAAGLVVTHNQRVMHPGKYARQVEAKDVDIVQAPRVNVEAGETEEAWAANAARLLRKDARYFTHGYEQRVLPVVDMSDREYEDLNLPAHERKAPYLVHDAPYIGQPSTMYNHVVVLYSNAVLHLVRGVREVPGAGWTHMVLAEPWSTGGFLGPERTQSASASAVILNDLSIPEAVRGSASKTSRVMWCVWQPFGVWGGGNMFSRATDVEEEESGGYGDGKWQMQELAVDGTGSALRVETQDQVLQWVDVGAYRVLVDTRM